MKLPLLLFLLPYKQPKRNGIFTPTSLHLTQCNTLIVDTCNKVNVHCITKNLSLLSKDCVKVVKIFDMETLVAFVKSCCKKVPFALLLILTSKIVSNDFPFSYLYIDNVCSIFLPLQTMQSIKCRPSFDCLFIY